MNLRLTREDLVGGLRAVGIETGDVVYVASSLTALGLMENPISDTLRALREAVGSTGTLVLPTFNFDFCDGRTFDREKTPSRTGILSEAFRQMPMARRTWSPPFHTVSALGARADELGGIESLTSFGRDSVFQYLHDIGAKQLLLGCGFHEGAAHVHWLEECAEVPYRHWKRFEGEVVLSGKKSRRTFFMYARNPAVRIDAEPMGRAMAEAGLVQTTEVGLCRLQSFTLKDFKNFLGPRMAQNPFCFVAESDGLASCRTRYSPIKRLDHIGIVSRYSSRIREFFDLLPCRLSAEGVVADLGVNCQYWDGLNVTLEFVEPLHEESRIAKHREQHPTCPLHHLAFEVSDLGDAVEYFRQRGYEPMENQHYFGPRPKQRVMFLSPVQTGGLLVELVCADGGEYQVYGGVKC